MQKTSQRECAEENPSDMGGNSSLCTQNEKEIFHWIELCELHAIQTIDKFSIRVAL